MHAVDCRENASRKKRENKNRGERQRKKEAKLLLGSREQKKVLAFADKFFHCSVCEITKKKQKMGGTKKLFSFFSLRFTEIAISQALISVVLALSRHFAKALAASEAD